MADALLEVKDLKKYFKTKMGMLHAVDGVDFSINQGETMGLVGESGCGKSTVGRVLLRLLEPTGGECFFEGENVFKFKKDKMREMRQKMQIIFQDPFSSLNPRMSLFEIIAEPLVINKKARNKVELYKMVHSLMDTVGLASRLENVYPHELDGGRRQRIGVARALALNPKFIVCDEPVSALDVSIQAQIINLMLDLQEERGLAYMFVTHDLSVVKYISNDIIVMYLGHMVEMASSEELFEAPLHPYTKALLSAIPEPDIHAPADRIIMEGELTSPINPKPGCRFMARCRYADEGCGQPQVLEEHTTGHFVMCCRYKTIIN